MSPRSAPARSELVDQILESRSWSWAASTTAMPLSTTQAGSRITPFKSRESSEVHLSRILGDPEILGGDEESGMFHYA
jgi:hypothetical protein